MIPRFPDRRSLIIIGLSAALLATVAAAAPSSTVRAGAAKVDLTPSVPKLLGGYGPRESTGVLDPVHHRVLVLDDGKSEWVLVSSEFCVMSPATYDRVAARLERELGIPPVSFWWTLTHTHSAPQVGSPGIAQAYLPERYEHRVDEEYAQFVEDNLVKAVSEARARKQPARLGVAWGTSNANINRRARDVGGQTTLGMNPDLPVDRRLGVLRVLDQSGAVIAHVANYPIHGTVLSGANLLISGDAPGVVSNYLEEQLGGTVLFVNGAAGNVAPIYSVYPNPRAGHLSQFRVLLGDRIREAVESIDQDIAVEAIAAREIMVDLPRRADLTWPAEMARFAGTSSDGAPLVKLPIRVLSLNRDIAIWGAPLELFNEVAVHVRDQSPYSSTFYFGYNNGWFGYLMTDEELKFGGYESRVTPFTAGAAPRLSERVLKELNDLRRTTK